MNRFSHWLSLLAFLSILPLPAPADERSKEWTVTSFMSSEIQRDRWVELAPSKTATLDEIRLAPTHLLSDAMARSSKVLDEIAEGESARRDFHLDSKVDSVEVLVYAGWNKHASPEFIEVNGRPYRHRRDAEKMLTGGWDRFAIPEENLVVGRNEIVFNGPCVLWLDEDSPGGKSFKRLSPEGPWRSDCLGSADDARGEYMIRFRVRGRPSEGTAVSPVIDLNDRPHDTVSTDGEKPAPAPKLEIERLDLSFAQETPKGTKIQYEIRSGGSPEPHPSEWSDWRPAEKADMGPIGRFVQWRAVLSTEDADLSPALRTVTFHVRAREAGANFDRLEWITPPDNRVDVSSYPFTYADPHHPRMRHLREKYDFPSIAAPGQTDMEKFMLVSQWIREQWEGWDMGVYDYCPQWDALEILELAPAKLALGMCTHYAAVFVQAIGSLGYTARSVIVDHHCLAEAWSDHYGKWVFVDTGLLAKNPIALKYVDREGIPLNAIELHERFLSDDASDVTVVPDPSMSMEEFWKRYLNLYCRFAIPLRNDHLYNPMPQELEHGHMQYHWDGYLWWTDDLDPKYPEYSLLTNRREDFYWTVNKTLIDLEDTLEEGRVEVRLHGPIPNLKHFLVKRGEGDWEESGSMFEWSLAPGENRLAARAVNTMGLELPIHEVVLKYTP